jgi:hypothetical protein
MKATTKVAVSEPLNPEGVHKGPGRSPSVTGGGATQVIEVCALTVLSQVSAVGGSACDLRGVWSAHSAEEVHHADSRRGARREFTVVQRGAVTFVVLDLDRLHLQQKVPAELLW